MTASIPSIRVTYEAAAQARLDLADVLSALPGYSRRLYARLVATAYYHAHKDDADILPVTTGIAAFLGGGTVRVQLISGQPEFLFELEPLPPVTDREVRQ